jgi:hypothetical protein
LQSRGNVDSVPEEVPSTRHYVSDVNAYAELDGLFRRNTCVRLSESGLCCHSALYGVNGARKLREHAVARRVGYAAPVLLNDPIEDRAPFGQTFERADLIGAHEAAVALDICCEDCDEASADFRRV